MRQTTQLIANLFAKFGILTASDLVGICASQCKQRMIYLHLKDLMESGLIRRMAHPSKATFVYQATPALYGKEVNSQTKVESPIRIDQLAHVVACNRAMFSLSHYSYVAGFALAHELDLSEIRKFCFDRIPDGIVKIVRPDIEYELAVEVETSIKSIPRIRKIFNSYCETWDKKTYPCAGVIIIAPNASAYQAYQNEMETIPEANRKRIVLKNSFELLDLNERYFGTKLNDVLQNVQKPLQKTRTVCNEGVRYLPIVSTNEFFLKAIKGHIPVPSQRLKQNSIIKEKRDE